jgi:hypothetical protein
LEKNVDKYLLTQKQRVIEEREKEEAERKEMDDKMSIPTIIFMFLASVLVVSAIASGIG